MKITGPHQHPFFNPSVISLSLPQQEILNSMAAPKQQSSTNKNEHNHHNSSTARKASSSSAVAAAGRPTSQEQAALKCPRCDSQNTKFCYYNNYSLTQPRHFCKTCRRYWTKGGALRNVPIGGGCRKNKKTKSSSSSSRLGNLESKDNNNHILSSTDIGGVKFFHGLAPAMDFQFGGLSIPRLHSSSPTGGMYSQFTSFVGDMAATTTGSVASTSCFSLDPSGRSSPNLMGFNFPFSPMLKVQSETTIPAGGFNNSTAGGEVQEMGSLNHHTSLASSIESLSSINQDLHWKLQQQRLAILFGGENNQKESNINVSSAIPLVGNEVQHQQKPQPILFHNLEVSTPKNAIGAVDDSSSRREGSTTGTLSTEWFFDNSYAPVTQTPTNSNSNGNGNHDHQNINNWNGIQAWSNMSQYNEL